MNFKKSAIGVGAMLLSSVTWAESYMYLTNNTDQTLDLTINQRGSALVKGEHWWQHATAVPPYGTVRFLETNRDSGIKWGSDYYFDTTVTSEDGSAAVLQQKLTGTWNFSDIWHGTQQSPWYSDRNIHSVSQDFAGPGSTIAFKAEFARVNGDDYYYVIQPKDEVVTRGLNNNFKVLAYNVWALLPGIVSRSVGERLNLLKNKLNGYDAIVFSELFDNGSRETFLNAIRTEYPYQTSVVDRSGSIEDGGVLIVSRYPIDSESQIVYSACNGEDCISAKGVIYAEINKGGNPYHIFGSHTQAWTKEASQATRVNQFNQMRDFIDSRNISADEPVIIAGDLNVDKEDFPQEYNAMLSILNAEEVPRAGGYAYTADGRVNGWTDSDPEILDYVLYSTAHLNPTESSAKVLIPRSIHADVFTKYDLSDHFPIAGNLTFDTPEGEAVDPIGATGSNWNQWDGGLKHVSIAADGTVWGVNNGDYIYRRNGNSWQNIPGRLKQVSTGSSSNVWGVNSADDIFYWANSNWQLVSGKLKQISAAEDGSAWGVNSNNSVFRRNGSSWAHMPGVSLSQVSVGSASNVWGLTSSGSIHHWDGSNWSSVGGNLKHIDVASDGSVWGVSYNDEIFVRSTGSWTLVPGYLKQISVGGVDKVMGVNSSDMIYKREFN